MIIILILVFAFYCFLSSFWAINPNLSITNAKTILLLGMFLWIAYNFFCEMQDSENKLLKINILK